MKTVNPGVARSLAYNAGMSSQPAERRIWTREEYLAFERSAPQKHEFHDGEIFAMAGAKFRHNQVAANLIAQLAGALRDRPCHVLTSDMKVRIPGKDRYKYPDAMVVCGAPLFEDEHEDILLNPQAIFEVLSESTESYDRGLKFEDYRTLPALRDYVLLSPDRVLVEHYARQADDSWLLREVRAGGRLCLITAACEIAADEIYLKVFPEPA